MAKKKVTQYSGLPDEVYFANSPTANPVPAPYLQPSSLNYQLVDNIEWGQVRYEIQSPVSGETILATIVNKSLLMTGSISLSKDDSLLPGSIFVELRLRRSGNTDIVLISCAMNTRAYNCCSNQTISPAGLILRPGDILVEKHAFNYISGVGNYVDWQVGFTAVNIK